MIEEWCLYTPVEMTREQAAKALGYKKKLISVTFDWFSLDTCEVTWEQNLEAQDTISSLGSRFFLPYAPLEPETGTLKIENLTLRHKLKKTERSKKGGKERWYYVSIDPPLNKGELLHYKIQEKFNNLFLTTKGEINEKIMKGEWKFDEPKEYVSTYIVTPLDELKLRVIFPKGYIVKKEKRGHEVRFAKTPGVLIDETEMSEYSESAKEERQILKLRADKPRLFGNYYLLWEPPN